MIKKSGRNLSAVSIDTFLKSIKLDKSTAARTAVLYLIMLEEFYIFHKAVQRTIQVLAFDFESAASK